jgi:chlorite dismutase
MESLTPAEPSKPAKPQSNGPATSPPETLEGWFALHQIFSVDRDAARARRSASDQGRPPDRRGVSNADVSSVSGQHAGWSALVSLIGSKADVMAMHFRSTLDEIGDAQRAFARDPAARSLTPVYSFLSVTEAGLYHLTAELARKALARGGSVGDEPYVAELTERAAAERGTAHVQRRLYPAIPDGMPYVSFYPMSKRRDPGQNWYGLSLDDRSRLMYAHGMTGRRYSGKVLQIITGAVGFDAWEWGVTLFAKDPLDFKKLVTDMRFDEVSANYADFGEFFVGRLMPSANLAQLVETIAG